MNKFYSLKIQSIVRETKKAVSITFLVPSYLKSEFTFKSGQYITLKTLINGSEVRRDYSLSSSPKSGDLTITVKEIEKGLFSTYANNTLNPGDYIEVGIPNGRFIYEPQIAKKSSIVAFAAGSGITPIISIIKTALLANTDNEIILIYGNKSPEQTIFHNELLDLQERNSDRFKIQFVYSESDEEGAIFGRINIANVNYILKNNIDLNSSQLFYLCGPEEMIKTTSRLLSENDVQDDRILFELFTSSKIPQEKSAISDGKTEITLLVDEEKTTLLMSKSQTVLEVALENDIDAPYSCQGGVCSSCICRVTEGSAVMRQNNILTDSEVNEGLVLSCQAEPTSSIIKVDFDDV